MSAVETVELTKDYPVGFWRKVSKRALDGLTFQVEPSQVFGLLGPNGAGKSTTLKILLGLVFPTSGKALLFDRPPADIAAHRRLGYLPEQPYFYDHLTAEEFLGYMADLFGLSSDERRRRVGELLERVGLDTVRNVPLRKYSKGMVQRVGIAQALINDPELVILDEPMSGLDPVGRRQVRDLILELKRQQKTILFSTHILSDAETLCDQVAILNRGRLEGCGLLHEILRLGVTSTEIVLENPTPELLGELSLYARQAVRTGDRVRLEIREESDVARAVEAIVKARVRIVSLNVVKATLEDYFLEKVGAAEGAPASEARVRMTE
jgi:ABC-2 type transport system ATP-binding protein